MPNFQMNYWSIPPFNLSIFLVQYLGERRFGSPYKGNKIISLGYKALDLRNYSLQREDHISNAKWSSHTQWYCTICDNLFNAILVTNPGEVILINAVFISFYLGVTIYVNFIYVIILRRVIQYVLKIEW